MARRLEIVVSVVEVCIAHCKVLMLTVLSQMIDYKRSCNISIRIQADRRPPTLEQIYQPLECHGTTKHYLMLNHHATNGTLLGRVATGQYLRHEACL